MKQARQRAKAFWAWFWAKERRFKAMVHFGVLFAVTHSLWLEGAKSADLWFLALSVLTELDGHGPGGEG